MIEKILRESIKAKEKILNNKVFLKNIEKVVSIITECIKKKNKVILMGNGGSAADAQHFAGEFINRFLMERKPLPAISLSTDSSVLTCIGNDYSFKDIFKKQVEALATDGDILIGITTSGNSENILEGFKAGKTIGTVNVGLLGKDGGLAKEFCDISLIVPLESTPRIQEVHITVIHIICELVEKNIFGSKRNLL